MSILYGTGASLSVAIRNHSNGNRSLLNIFITHNMFLFQNVNLFCVQVKDLFKELKIEFNVMELDLMGKTQLFVLTASQFKPNADL